MSPDPAAVQPGDMTPIPVLLGPISTVGTDGSTISTDQIDPELFAICRGSATRLNTPHQASADSAHAQGPAMSSSLSCLVTDYGSTISADAIDHLIGQKPVDPAAAATLRTLHDDLALRIILASNTERHETRWPALQKAGIADLFSVALLSYPLGIGKPDPVFYQLVLAAAQAPPEQVLFVGDNLHCDVIAPLAHGMRTALVRPDGLRPGESLPNGALLIRHVRDLPALLETM
ncbi:HAD family hydrolase [Actinomadura sp. SCN-SB]|uniref:HAD family hydrolase n=1 Tax=Actinomadura sp. SCN-SB TaxID=3373092 RepID=UPI003750AA70